MFDINSYYLVLGHFVGWFTLIFIIYISNYRIKKREND